MVALPVPLGNITVVGTAAPMSFASPSPRTLEA